MVLGPMYGRLMRYSSLKVILNGGPEQNSPLIEHELPYSFSIVTRLPPQPRSRGEVVGDVAPPPTKRPRTRSRRAGRAGNAAPQSVVSSDPDEISFGDSRGSTNNIPLGTSENLVPPMEHRHPAPPAEAAMPPHQCRQTVNTPSGEETVDGLNLVIERINPCQGPTAGGPEIWISGSNFPTHLMPLYARFGDNCAHVVGVRPQFGNHLTASRSLFYLACSRVVCLRPMFRAWFQCGSPIVSTQALLFWVQVFVNSNTSLTLTRCKSRYHPLWPLLT